MVTTPGRREDPSSAALRIALMAVAALIFSGFDGAALVLRGAR